MLIMRYFYSILTFTILFLSHGFAQDNESSISHIFVTGVAVPIETDRAGVGTTVISNKDIENIKPNTVEDILKTVPGISIKQNSSGKLSTLYMRGAGNGSTMILIDGIPISDAAGINSDIDLSSLPINNIDRIEIIKGPSSAALGAAAMNGAINIITKASEGDKPIRFDSNLQSMLWKLNFKGSGYLSGKKGIAEYRLGGGFSYDENISAAAEKYGNTEKDPDSMGNAQAFLKLTPVKDFSTSISLNYVDRESHIDNGGGSGMDALDYLQRTRRFNGILAAKYLLKDIWEPKLSLSYSYQHRTYGTSKVLKEDRFDIFDGNTVILDFTNNFYILDELSLNAGFNYKFDNIFSRAAFGSNFVKGIKDAHNLSGYAEANAFLFNCWTIIGTFRAQKEENASFAPLYRVSTSLEIPKTYGFTLKASVGNGSMAPSLYQLYDPMYGNNKLLPQESFGYEVGIAQNILKYFQYGLSWFDNYYTNMISWGSYRDRTDGKIKTGFYNEGESHTRGIEAEISVTPLKWIEFKAAYTYLQTFNSQGNPLPRRPAHQFSTSLFIAPAFVPKNALKIFIELIFHDKSVAGLFDTTEYNDGYWLLNATISYDITPSIQIYLKGTNLLNYEYEEIAGYGMKGVEVFLGANAKF